MKSTSIVFLAVFLAHASGCQAFLGIDDVTARSPDGALPDGAGLPDAAAIRQYRKQITIPATQIQSTLNEFPVLISLVDSDLAAHALPAGNDIYFTREDGTPLDHEMERWTAGDGQLVAWVKIPVLSSNTDTIIYMYYGDGDAAGPNNPSAVWSNGFLNVWHLGEDPGQAGANGIVDATTRSHATANGGMNADDRVSAQIGYGLDFDGDNDELTFTNRLSGNTAHTISVWINQRSTSEQSMIIAMGDSDSNQARWLKSVNNDGNIAGGFYGNDWGSFTNIRNTNWRLLHWTFTGNTSRWYLDGAWSDASSTHNYVDTQGGIGVIGNAGGGFGSNLELSAQLDELRVANVSRDAAWIAAEFANQSDPASFYTVGLEEALQ